MLQDGQTSSHYEVHSSSSGGDAPGGAGPGVPPEYHYVGTVPPPPDVVSMLSRTGLTSGTASGIDAFGLDFGSLELDDAWRAMAPSRPRSAFSLLGDSFFNDSTSKFSTLRGGLLGPLGPRDPLHWFNPATPFSTPTPTPTPAPTPTPTPTPRPGGASIGVPVSVTIRVTPQPSPAPPRPAPSFGMRGARGFSGTQQYEVLKQQCRTTGALFEDSEVFDYLL